jgi:hypothetical protein
MATPNQNIIYRSGSTEPLTFDQLDGNFALLSQSIADVSNPFPFTGNAVFSGSILVSGSIIPNTNGVSSTSSFSLGSPTNAWKDIYVSNGTINFLDGAGNVQSTLGTGTNALSGNTSITGSLFVNVSGQLNQIVQGPNHNLGGNPGATGIHMEGRNNQVSANASYSHVEGTGNAVSGYACHAEGGENIINTNTTGSHAEGYQTIISSGANYSHAEGSGTIVSGSYAHAEGIGAIAIGTASHAEGLETIAKGNFQHVAGQYNATSSVDSAFIVGNGADGDNRSNLIFAAEETVSINSLLQLTRRTTNPISPIEGSIMASGSAGSSKLYYYNGTTWVDLTA